MDTFYHLLPSKTPLPKPQTKNWHPPMIYYTSQSKPDDTEERISRDEQFVAKSSVTHLTSIPLASRNRITIWQPTALAIGDMFNLISFKINSTSANATKPLWLKVHSGLVVRLVCTFLVFNYEVTIIILIRIFVMFKHLFTI
jgi:hypothetical protein